MIYEICPNCGQTKATDSPCSHCDLSYRGRPRIVKPKINKTSIQKKRKLNTNKGKRICPKCDGTGEPMGKCRRCGGSGWL